MKRVLWALLLIVVGIGTALAYPGTIIIQNSAPKEHKDADQLWGIGFPYINEKLAITDSLVTFVPYYKPRSGIFGSSSSYRNFKGVYAKLVVTESTFPVEIQLFSESLVDTSYSTNSRLKVFISPDSMATWEARCLIDSLRIKTLGGVADVYWSCY